jgi:hypothetical protein
MKKCSVLATYKEMQGSNIIGGREGQAQNQGRKGMHIHVRVGIECNI